MDKLPDSIRTYRYHSGRWETVDAGVIVEQSVSLTVNGKEWLSFLCTPQDLEALAAGFLYNENVIEAASEIASIRVCPSGDNIDVWLTRSVEEPSSWRRTSGCAGGFTRKNPAISSSAITDAIILSPAKISGLIHKLFESQDLYRQFGGVHTSVLSDGEQILVKAEDIGRHNTLDKLAGYCLLRQMIPTRRILITTGRISSEMLQKASRLGVSVVISRTSPSTLSVDMAQSNGITLIGYARRDSFIVYTHPYRVLPGPESLPVSNASTVLHSDSPPSEGDEANHES